jgi:hypothetical protein
MLSGSKRTGHQEQEPSSEQEKPNVVDYQVIIWWPYYQEFP